MLELQLGTWKIKQENRKSAISTSSYVLVFIFCFSFVKLSAHSGSTMEVLTLNWKKVLFTIAAIQVGTGVTIIGVLSFIPLFLVEMGVNDPGEAAFWAGL